MKDIYVGYPLCLKNKIAGYFKKETKEELLKAFKSFMKEKGLDKCDFFISHLKEASPEFEEFSNFEENGKKYFLKMEKVTLTIEKEDIDLFTEFMSELDEVICDLFQEDWDFLSFRPIKREFCPEKLDELEAIIKKIRQNEDEILKQIDEFNKRKENVSK